MRKKHQYSYSLTGLVVASVSALIIGGSLMFLIIGPSKNTTEAENPLSGKVLELEQQLEEASERADQAKEQLIESQKLNSEIIATLNENGIKQEDPYRNDFIALLSPRGGETFCIGEKTTIDWEGQGDLSSVSITFKNAVSGGVVASIPFNNNETGEATGGGQFQWEVGRLANGTVLSQDSTYEMIIEGNYSARDRANGRSSVKDFTDGLVTLVLCQG